MSLAHSGARAACLTGRTLARFTLDPAAYCRPEWISSGLRRFVEVPRRDGGPGHGRAALSAMLLQRYRLECVFDPRLLEGARRAALLSPACFERLLVLVGIVHHGAAIAGSLDARLFRSIQAAAPEVDVMALLHRTEATLQSSGGSPPRPPWTDAETPVSPELTAAGERTLARAASAWGAAVSDRVRLRLRRGPAARRASDDGCVLPREALEARLDGCIAALEAPRWL